MQSQSKFAKLAVLVIMGSLSLSTLAAAESDAARAIRASAATAPTNIPGIRSYAEPPAGFNAATASDEELATYGFPSRPDKQAHPNEYAHWERAMKLARTRWNGELKALPGGGMKVSSGSSALPEAVQAEAGTKQIQTNSASGAVVTSNQKTFNKNSIGILSPKSLCQRPSSLSTPKRVAGKVISQSALSGLTGLSSIPAMAMDSTRSWRPESTSKFRAAETYTISPSPDGKAATA